MSNLTGVCMIRYIMYNSMFHSTIIAYRQVIYYANNLLTGGACINKMYVHVHVITLCLCDLVCVLVLLVNQQ